MKRINNEQYKYSIYDGEHVYGTYDTLAEAVYNAEWNDDVQDDGYTAIYKMKYYDRNLWAEGTRYNLDGTEI